MGFFVFFYKEAIKPLLCGVSQILHCRGPVSNTETSWRRQWTVGALQAVQKVSVEQQTAHALRKHRTVVEQKWCHGTIEPATISMH